MAEHREQLRTTYETFDEVLVNREKDYDVNLIYITGLSGAGKSAALRELSERGFEAHGVDEEGFADWIDRGSGRIAPFPHHDLSLDIHDWYRKHRWVLSEERITTLRNDADKDNKTYRGLGALVIDATKPLDQVVSNILEAVPTPPRAADVAGDFDGRGHRWF